MYNVPVKLNSSWYPKVFIKKHFKLALNALRVIMCFKFG